MSAHSCPAGWDTAITEAEQAIKCSIGFDDSPKNPRPFTYRIECDVEVGHGDQTRHDDVRGVACDKNGLQIVVGGLVPPEERLFGVWMQMENSRSLMSQPHSNWDNGSHFSEPNISPPLNDPIGQTVQELYRYDFDMPRCTAYHPHIWIQFPTS